MSEDPDNRQSSIEPRERRMPKEPRDYDMDDSDEFERWPNLKSELIYCKNTVGKAYHKADSASMFYRTTHKVLVFVATACGMLAVLFAIVQLSPFQQPNIRWVLYAEAGAAFVAVVAVVFGILAALSKRWTLEREKAEHCRYLKFGFLIRPTLWTPQNWLHHRVQELSRVPRETLEHWAEREEDPFEDTSLDVPAKFDKAKLEDLVNYYREKRLCYQRSYFEAQAQRRDRWERFTSLAPVLCFFASILAALGHFVYDFVYNLIHGSSSHSELEGISLALVFLAACLPVFGAAVRTLRIAHEFGRNALRFRATALDLRQLEAKWQGEASLQGKLKVLQEAEQVLEIERREWLRLMIDVEWYG
jgi:hypothetical protein